MSNGKTLETFGDGSKTGYLLYGPPGCGKTSIAKAVANEAGTSFIHIQGPELMNKFVGESELALRTIFSRARKCSPCILFIDEIDARTKKRGKEGGSSVDDRLLTQLMLELDGGEQHKGVYVIAATNRPLAMDRAVLRAGRLGKHIYVSLPNQDQCLSILKALTRNMTLDTDVDLDATAQSEACKNLSGADLTELIELAKSAAYEEYLKTYEAAALEGTDLGDMPCPIKAVHFEIALGIIKPSISEKDKRRFDRMSKRFKKR
ncbi:cell division control protein 48 homolog C-like [Bidens hawaiensis]|uniref:cell division control protein 48 homolog C-like n=1 Tax=Bidens hawaiensis TaxID=980011 RepID=UPI0040499A4B